jgi:Peptidase family M3
VSYPIYIDIVRTLVEVGFDFHVLVCLLCAGSEVFAADMFETAFASKDPLSAEQGLRYRKHILQNGGAEDAAVFLREFLGREPNSAAFLKSKGLAMK